MSDTPAGPGTTLVPIGELARVAKAESTVAEMVRAGAARPAALAELAATANAEHEAVRMAGGRLLQHAMAVGDALLAAKAQVPHGEWEIWLRENLAFGRVTAHRYMRVAIYRERITTSAAVGVSDALALVAHEPHARGFNAVQGTLGPYAQELRAEGLTQRQIGEALGVSQSQVARLLNPKIRGAERRQQKASRREAARAQRALQREEEAKAARAKGGPGSEGYALIRRAQLQVQAAMEAEGDREAKQGFRDAYSHLARAEDSIVGALGVSSPGRLLHPRKGSVI